jgi:hypothetical protein
MNPGPSRTVDYAVRLLEQGLICVPLSREGRHLDLEAMGYHPLHLQTLRKKLKELAFASVAFHFSQHPPDSDTLADWIGKSSGNLGIIGGYLNLAILDFDRTDLYEKWRRKQPGISSSTPTAKSPNGFHVYLQTAKPEISSSLHFGFKRAGHIKALGGYVLTPPPETEGEGAYQWLPGLSPFEVRPRRVESLRSLSLLPVGRLRDVHDRVFKRGWFEPK